MRIERMTEEDHLLFYFLIFFSPEATWTILNVISIILYEDDLDFFYNLLFLLVHCLSLTRSSQLSSYCVSTASILCLVVWSDSRIYVCTGKKLVSCSKYLDLLEHRLFVNLLVVEDLTENKWTKAAIVGFYIPLIRCHHRAITLKHQQDINWRIETKNGHNTIERL